MVPLFPSAKSKTVFLLRNTALSFSSPLAPKFWEIWLTSLHKGEFTGEGYRKIYSIPQCGLPCWPSPISILHYNAESSGVGVLFSSFAIDIWNTPRLLTFSQSMRSKTHIGSHFHQGIIPRHVLGTMRRYSSSYGSYRVKAWIILWKSWLDNFGALFTNQPTELEMTQWRNP